MTFRISLILNALLIAGIIALSIFLIWREWLFAGYRDGRPQGSVVTLSSDQPVFDRIDGNFQFTLPKGTVLQESSPHGAATLGKSSYKEYLLVIKTSEPMDSASSTTNLGWMDNYRFKISQ